MERTQEPLELTQLRGEINDFVPLVPSQGPRDGSGPRCHSAQQLAWLRRGLCGSSCYTLATETPGATALSTFHTNLRRKNQQPRGTVGEAKPQEPLETCRRPQGKGGRDQAATLASERDAEPGAVQRLTGLSPRPGPIPAGRLSELLTPASLTLPVQKVGLRPEDACLHQLLGE